MQQQTLRQTLGAWTPTVLSLLRIVAAVLFLEHGTMKILGFPLGPAEQTHVAAGSLFWFAGLLELVGGAALLIGLFSRPVAFVLSGEMAFAYFLTHARHSPYPAANEGDASILFCFVFLYLVFAGPGPWSLDERLARRS